MATVCRSPTLKPYAGSRRLRPRGASGRRRSSRAGTGDRRRSAARPRPYLNISRPRGLAARPGGHATLRAFHRRALMRVLLSTIGSRGDVQPLVALALELKALGQDVQLCVPPDFRQWIESLGMPVTPIGPELRSTGKANPSAAQPSPERARQMAE